MIKTIGLDLDNTVFNLEPIYKMGFKFFAPTYKYTPPQYWEIMKCYPEPVALKIIELFGQRETYNTPLLNDEYPWLIYDWQQKYNVKIVTSRQGDESEMVLFRGEPQRRMVSWVKKQTYDQLWNNHIHVRIDDIIQTKSHDKISDIKQNNIDLMIDDSPLVIEECLNAGIDCVMISTPKTPYNHYLRQRVQWAKNLFEVNKMKQL